MIQWRNIISFHFQHMYQNYPMALRGSFNIGQALMWGCNHVTVASFINLNKEKAFTKHEIMQQVRASTHMFWHVSVFIKKKKKEKQQRKWSGYHCNLHEIYYVGHALLLMWWRNITMGIPLVLIPHHHWSKERVSTCYFLAQSQIDEVDFEKSKSTTSIWR